jgi:hypothetical protein
MLTEPITLEVESDAARLFNEATPSDKEKLQVLFGRWLRRYATSDVDSLKRTMDEIQRNAKARGMTPEILESILNNGQS